MIVTEVHVRYWQAKRRPSWAPPIKVTPASVHDCVNAHAGWKLPPERERDAGNAVSLLRLWRRNHERGAHRGYVDEPDSVVAYMAKLAWGAHAYQQPGRARYCARWVRAYARKQRRAAVIWSAR